MSINTPPLFGMLQTLAAPSEPNIVYHYTSLETMISIVKTQKMWATNIQYLNDTAERELFMTQALGRLASQKARYPEVDDDTFAMLNEHDPNRSAIANLPFVLSFSRDRDSLPQWRSYTPSGRGVSLGFDVSALRAAFVSPHSSRPSTVFDLEPHVTYGPVEYLGYFQDAQIDGAIRKAYSDAVEMMSRFEREEEISISVSDFFRSNLEDRATFYKDNSFNSEGEYRIVVGSIYWQWERLKFRCNRSTMVPYVEVNIPHIGIKPEDVQSGEMLPWDALKNVVIGPTANKDLTRRAVEAFFHSMKMAVDISTTSSSFRDF